jgi:hypothetical protein
MWDALVECVWSTVVAAVKAKPAAECLEAILGSHTWNGSRTAVHEVVGRYLARVLAGRGTAPSQGVKTTDSDKQVDMPAGPKHDIHVAAANQTAERDTRLANAASSNPQSNIINCCCVMNASVATTSIAYIHH